MDRILQLRPPRLAMALLAITIMLWHLSPKDTLLHLPNKLLGSVAIISGLGLMLYSWGQIKAARTPLCPTKRASVLIRRGAYGLTRNPMYLGMLVMLWGSAFLMSALIAALAPMAFFLAMDKYFIPFEEASLKEAFGAHYAEYEAKVRRWV